MIPASEQLSIGIAKETAHIGAAEREAGHRFRQTHLDRRLQMLPIRQIVTRPDGGQTLAARKVAARQDERTLRRVAAFHQTVVRGYQLHVRVQIVNVAMLPAVHVNDIFGHRHFRSIEYRRFVHIVPQHHVFGGAGEVLQLIAAGEVLSDVLSEQIWVAAGRTDTNAKTLKFKKKTKKFTSTNRANTNPRSLCRPWSSRSSRDRCNRCGRSNCCRV